MQEAKKLSAEELERELYLICRADNAAPVARDALQRVRAHIAALERELEAARALLLEDIRRANGCDTSICVDAQGPNCICNSDLNARLTRPGGQEKDGAEERPMADTAEIARALSAAQRALLRAWAAPRGARSRSPDYPNTPETEQQTMAELQAKGLFVIAQRDDPNHGPMESYYVSDLGRAVALELAKDAARPALTSADQTE